MFLSAQPSLLSFLQRACLLLTVTKLCAAATFDAKKQFAWVDSSCDAVIDKVNVAGDDYNGLVNAAVASFGDGSPTTDLGKMTLKSYFGTDVGDLIKFKYGKLQTAFTLSPIPLSLYCDGSAFEWVTAYSEGDKAGQTLPAAQFPNNGAWHSKADRWNPSEGPLYLSGVKTDARTNYCMTPEGAHAEGVSSIGGKHVVLCSDAFNAPVLGALPTAKQRWGTNIDDVTSTGSVLLHEVSHCILNTGDEQYKATPSIFLAQLGASRAQKNADNWMYYAMAVYLNQNAWVTGKAQETNDFGPKVKTGPAARRALSPFGQLLEPREAKPTVAPYPYVDSGSQYLRRRQGTGTRSGSFQSGTMSSGGLGLLPSSTESLNLSTSSTLVSNTASTKITASTSKTASTSGTASSGASPLSNNSTTNPALGSGSTLPTGSGSPSKPASSGILSSSSNSTIIPAPGSASSSGSGPSSTSNTGSSSNSGSSTDSGSLDTPTSTPTASLTVVIETSGSSAFSETFQPTQYTQYASLSSKITANVVAPDSSTVAVVIGPGGWGWSFPKVGGGLPEPKLPSLPPLLPVPPGPGPGPGPGPSPGPSPTKSGPSQSGPSSTGSSDPTTSTSSCSSTMTASDCNVQCTRTASSQSCRTTCFSITTGCSAQGTTMTTSGNTTSTSTGTGNYVVETGEIYSKVSASVDQSSLSLLLEVALSSLSITENVTDSASSPSLSGTAPTTLKTHTSPNSMSASTTSNSNTASSSSSKSLSTSSASTSSASTSSAFTSIPTSTTSVPSPSSSGSAPPPPPYATGTCHIHLQEWRPDNIQFNTQHVNYAIAAKLTDNNHTPIGHQDKIDSRSPVSIDSALADVMVITTEDGDHGGYVQFSLGAQMWQSGSRNCNLGGWSGNFGYTDRQMDCDFVC